jgi:hypothetical protein
MTDPHRFVRLPTVTITRYADRRLYDNTTLRYLSADDLRRMVQAGAVFVVLDAKTGEDVTQAVLSPDGVPAYDPWCATLDGLVALASGDGTEPDELPETVLDEADEVRRLIAVRIADARAAGTVLQGATLPAVWYRRCYDAVRIVHAREVQPEPEPRIDPKPPGAGRPAPRRPIARH